jgi:thiosulfate/3-mercaptopyruvate sulfurtransferase
VAVKTLISTADLHQLQQSADVAMIDCRFSLMDAEIGEQEYAEGHIPGARYAHLNRDLSGVILAGKTGRHPLPDRNVLVETVRRLGISNQQTVIAYDANTGAYAARLWWLLRWLGHDNVMVLDGGMDAWQADQLPVTKTVPSEAPSTFEPSNSLVRSTEAADLLTTEHQITDARDEARFRGEVEPIDSVAGHIPGATCLPFVDNLEQGRFKSAEALRARFIAAGLSSTEPTVCYCGSGVTACHNALALLYAGMPEPILYAGSWSEWITDPERPIATGE